MYSTNRVNDDSWLISINDLDLKSEGRYIACVLSERVRGFDTALEGSDVIKTSFPMITGNKIITSEIEVVKFEDIRVPCVALDHAWFFKQHQHSGCLATRWMVDTMKQLRALNVLRRMAAFSVATTIYTDPASQKQVTITSHMLIGKTHPQDKGFVFKQIVKQ